MEIPSLKKKTQYIITRAGILLHSIKFVQRTDKESKTRFNTQVD